MKEYIFKNIAKDDVHYPFVEFEIRIKAKDSREAWGKPLIITQEVDIPHCKLIND